MNLLLLGPAELREPGAAEVGLGRYPPRDGLWPPAPGRRLRIGLLNGRIGEAVVTAVDATHARLTYVLAEDPPTPLPLRVLLALPRPKMLRRILRCVAELGVKQLWLINSARVEKSYWKSPLLGPEMLASYCAAGLEQAIDTVMPAVHLQPRFKPFVEDELPGLAAGSTCLVAHPAARRAATPVRGPVTLAIGPEGGFTDYEIALLGTVGFDAITLGARVLRVETALPVLAATLSPAGS